MAGRIEILALETASLPSGAAQADAGGPGSAPEGQGQTSPGPGAKRARGTLTAGSAECVASMPAPDVMTRCWTFPEADDARCRQMVAHRLESDLPVPIDQVVWGYRRAGPASSREFGTWVLAQAARNDRVGRHMSSLSAAGFQIDALTTEAEALAALCRHGLQLGEASGTEALILATDAEWVIAVLIAGVVRSVRRVHVEPDQLERACLQCRQWIDADQPVHSLERVLWCAPEEMADARQVLAETMGIMVKPVEPADDLIEAGGGRISTDRLARFGPAIGLALAGLFERGDMIRLAGQPEEAATPRRQRIERILARPWRWTAVAGAGVILAAVIHVGALAWETRKMDRLLDAQDQARSAMATLGPKIRAMQQLQRYRIDVEGIVADLCSPIPESMVISSIRLSRERGLIIKGTAGDLKTSFALAEALRKNDRFAEVQTGRTEPGKGGGFTITAELVGVEKLSSFSGRGGPWR